MSRRAQRAHLLRLLACVLAGCALVAPMVVVLAPAATADSGVGPTETQLSSNPDPANASDDVTFTAQVFDRSSGCHPDFPSTCKAPSGTVTFTGYEPSDATSSFARRWCTPV